MATKNKHSIERIQGVIELCKSIDVKGLDPFSIDIDDIITILQQYFFACESTEEMTLDAEAVQHLASVIQNQGNWVKHRSTSLYTDPFLLEEKIQRLTKEQLAMIFMYVWNPIVELEQLSIPFIGEALQYWRELLPISERWQQKGPTEVISGETTRKELIQLKVLAEKAFMEEMKVLWLELRHEVGKAKKILYLDFVGADTYSETLNRAYMTSFLVTYGYATLQLVPLEEEVYIIPFTEPRTEQAEKQMVSVPIPISHKEWMKWKEEKLL